MSSPPSTAPQPPPHLPSATREYRKGNWTLQETLTVITAKKLDDDRRSQPNSAAKPRELRWKWVENYCWDHGCFRSQNQCNDKWDNLLRDYKKIRDFQSKVAASAARSSDSFPSYWSMDRQQRKYHNLPSNMSIEVFEALDEVIQRKYQSNIGSPLQLLPPPPEMGGAIDAPVVSGMDTSETESSEDKEDSSLKRRKVKRSIGASIKRSASMIAETMRKCEEKKDKRHQQVMEFEQRRLQLQQTTTEANRQGLSSLLMALSNLSSAIQSFISPPQT